MASSAIGSVQVWAIKKMPWLRGEFVPPSDFPAITAQDIMASFTPLKIS